MIGYDFWLSDDNGSGYWPGTINVYSETVGSVFEGFQFDTRMKEDCTAWSNALGITIGTVDEYIRYLLRYSQNLFMDLASMEIEIKTISTFNSGPDNCNSAIGSVCNCLLHFTHSSHHTSFEKMLDDQSGGTEGKSAKLYLTGHLMCFKDGNSHKTSVRGVALQSKNSTAATIYHDPPATRYTIAHEIGHLFGVDDHDSVGSDCTYKYTNREVICENCRQVILKNMGRYKE